MKSVYIVTAGEYSDYSIRAVFSNKANAKRFAEANQTEWYEFRVEEYLLDNVETQPGDRCYFGRVAKSGELFDIRTSYCDADELYKVQRDLKGNYYTYVMSKSEEHASKSIVDTVRKYRAVFE